MAKADLTAARLREVLHYEPATGIFTWARPTGRRTKPGDIAGSAEGRGYWAIRIETERYKAHRLAWLYQYGEWPQGDLDHINGDRCDNRITNLREASRSTNIQNLRTAKSHNRSGFLGVILDLSKKTSKRYTARIVYGGRQHSLGYYDTPEEAHAVYLEAKRKHHPGCVI